MAFEAVVHPAFRAAGQPSTKPNKPKYIMKHIYASILLLIASITAFATCASAQIQILLPNGEITSIGDSLSGMPSLPSAENYDYFPDYYNSVDTSIGFSGVYANGSPWYCNIQYSMYCGLVRTGKQGVIASAYGILHDEHSNQSRSEVHLSGSTLCGFYYYVQMYAYVIDGNCTILNDSFQEDSYIDFESSFYEDATFDGYKGNPNGSFDAGVINSIYAALRQGIGILQDWMSTYNLSNSDLGVSDLKELFVVMNDYS